MVKKKYDTYLDSILDDSFILRQREYFNDKGDFVVEGISKAETDLPYPDEMVILSTLMTNMEKPWGD